MTDASFSVVKPVNGPEKFPPSLSPALSPLHHQRYGAPAVERVNEEDGQISCICGYADDDGSTIACDSCNRWQHIVCYYPDVHDPSNLSPDFSHFCVECQPRALEVDKARDSQRSKREPTEALTNGTKRTAPKGQKKKVKDAGAAYTNGWPLDKSRHDRNSASPRDQPPPAKRPKTSHRTSDSITTTATVAAGVKAHSRKRTVSNVNHRRSVSRSPDAPFELYSEEFLRCYLEDNWEVTHANLHNSIAITNALSEWLNASEDDFQDQHKHEKKEVLMRWDGRLDDIPGKAQIEILENHDDTVQYSGLYPTWKLVAVKEPIASGAYIGELKGHVGFKRDYQEDISNRWPQLRHPEPFVFFHPKLPIVIDARNEGTELRYVRRSCMPNAQLQILITDGVDYHFCFMAIQQIDPGDEVAVGWDTSDGLPELAYRNNVSPEDMELLSGWVSTALANCGPCACQRPEGECRMSRFDRRKKTYQTAPPAKALKNKKRKPGHHISPPTTQGINSRSGSEGRKVDPDDEPTDSHSTSGSAGRGSASRDITPNTHYTGNGSVSNMPELSERERKKLAKEEEMFRRQEEERTGKRSTKKRNSGGSNLNTPNATTSKQLGFPRSADAPKHADAGTSRPTDLPSSKAPGGRRTKYQKTMSRQPVGTVKSVKPTYVNAETQCDLDEEEVVRQKKPAFSRKRFVSTRQRLLERVARNNSLIYFGKLPQIKDEPQGNAIEDDRMDIVSAAPNIAQSIPPPVPMPEHMDELELSTSDPIKEVEMQDAGSDDAPKPLTLDVDTKQEQSVPSPLTNPPPAWPSADGSDTTASAQPTKPRGVHLQMPPPPANPFTSPTPPLSAGTPGAAGPNNLIQSPTSVTGTQGMFSPSVTAAVMPSPARKKLSLSDYTRRKAKDKDHEPPPKVDRDSSPTSTASGPVASSVQPSTSTDAKANDADTVVDENAIMEDAGDDGTVNS